MSVTYPLAPNGIFRTIQGEGILSGLPMVFIRLAGCDVNCGARGGGLCDTDYSISEKLDLKKIQDRVSRFVYHGTEYVWLTGGEPTLYELEPLLDTIRSISPNLRIALATAGERKVKFGSLNGGFDFVSVSPHRPDKWIQLFGNQVNLVSGLGEFSLHDFLPKVESKEFDFNFKYVTPVFGSEKDFEKCLQWVNIYPSWRINHQSHKSWNIP